MNSIQSSLNYEVSSFFGNPVNVYAFVKTRGYSWKCWAQRVPELNKFKPRQL